MTRRWATAGGGLALFYVVVAALTAHLSSRPVLPLFDGFAPPTPYAWVNPPPERAGDNVVPKPVERDIPFGTDGVAATNASTDDAQAIIGLDKGSVPAHPPDTGVKVRIIPGDAGALGPLPPGLRVVSNAYRVEATYLPSGTPVTRLATKGTVALTAADAGDRMLFSSDGQTWQEVTFRPYGQDHGVFTELETTGWFVVASSVRAASGGASGSDALRTVLLVLAGVVPIIGAILVLRLPSSVPAVSSTRAAPTRSRPGGGKKRTKKPGRPRR
ncbi:MAG TPA: hypothetical protein VMZ73_08785 [Acidimicrobiales bacterium]|nr:hypothetical protein [Acidimicrobiales bacterium]